MILFGEEPSLLGSAAYLGGLLLIGVVTYAAPPPYR
jgi:hypothetical protein